MVMILEKGYRSRAPKLGWGAVLLARAA
jgi:hypothetical protein